MLYDDIQDFAHECYPKRSSLPPLETYLRSLLALVAPIEETALQQGEFIKLFRDALVSEPAAFEPDWDALKDSDGPLESFGKADCLVLVKRQVSDLRWLHESGKLDTQFAYFGVKTKTQDTWYNFDVSGYFECASAGLESSMRRSKFRSPWSLLATILLLGQIYE